MDMYVWGTALPPPRKRKSQLLSQFLSLMCQNHQPTPCTGIFAAVKAGAGGAGGQHCLKQVEFSFIMKSGGGQRKMAGIILHISSLMAKLCQFLRKILMVSMQRFHLPWSCLSSVLTCDSQGERTTNQITQTNTRKNEM